MYCKDLSDCLISKACGDISGAGGHSDRTRVQKGRVPAVLGRHLQAADRQAAVAGLHGAGDRSGGGRHGHHTPEEHGLKALHATRARTQIQQVR